MNEQQLTAVKQALEAFDVLSMNDYSGYECSKHETDKIDAAITALQSIISQDALDKKAENARELGLSYEPALMQQPVAWTDLLKQAEEVVRSKSLWKKYIDGTPLANDIAVWMVNFAQEHTTPPAAQPAVQDGRDWSLLEATQESLREHMAEIKRLKAAQPAPVMTDEKGRPLSFWGGKRVEPIAQPAPMQEPVVCMRCATPKKCAIWGCSPNTWPSENTTPPAPQPAPVKTYHDGKPWPVAPKPWVGLTDEDIEQGWKASWVDKQAFESAVWWAEKKLKEKNHDQ